MTSAQERRLLRAFAATARGSAVAFDLITAYGRTPQRCAALWRWENARRVVLQRLDVLPRDLNTRCPGG